MLLGFCHWRSVHCAIKDGFGLCHWQNSPHGFCLTAVRAYQHFPSRYFIPGLAAIVFRGCDTVSWIYQVLTQLRCSAFDVLSDTWGSICGCIWASRIVAVSVLQCGSVVVSAVVLVSNYLHYSSDLKDKKIIPAPPRSVYARRLESTTLLHRLRLPLLTRIVFGVLVRTPFLKVKLIAVLEWLITLWASSSQIGLWSWSKLHIQDACKNWHLYALSAIQKYNAATEPSVLTT